MAMNKLLDQAMTIAASLSDESQSVLARHVMDEAKRLAILEGLADADAGRLVDGEAVTKWLQSWGTGDEFPPPSCK